MLPHLVINSGLADISLNVNLEILVNDLREDS